MVEDVKASNNLVDSPVRLVAGEELDFNLEESSKLKTQTLRVVKKYWKLTLTMT